MWLRCRLSWSKHASSRSAACGPLALACEAANPVLHWRPTALVLLETEDLARKERIAQIVEILASNTVSRRRGDDQLARALQCEILDLGRQSEAEIAERAKEDDQIALALDRYTDQLQTSLKVLGSSV